jgi:hypothetical protein
MRAYYGKGGEQSGECDRLHCMPGGGRPVGMVELRIKKETKRAYMWFI